MGHPRLTASRDAEWPDFLQRVDPVFESELPDVPAIIRMHEADASKKLAELVAGHPVTKVVDNYDEQLAELFLSRDAHLYRANPEVQKASIHELLSAHYAGRTSWLVGSWVYYPWSGKLVHVLEEALFLELRTIRNTNLLTKEEQASAYGMAVGCAGLSVGSGGALALGLATGAQKIRLADGAVISGSNLNRILTGVEDVGEEKSLVIARKLYEMNPYLAVDRMTGKLTTETMEHFFDHDWPLDVVIDEIDDLKMKIILRIEARKRKLPVLMATDLGDNVMLDVERFDLDDTLPLFHGLAGNIEEILEQEHIPPQTWLRLATTIIGPANVPLRMQQSLLQVGTKLPTQPQLGTTVMMAGAVLAFAVRQLALKGPLVSGRTSISLEDTFLTDRDSRRFKKELKNHTKILDSMIKAMK